MTRNLEFMPFFHELRQRRVPQYVSAYIVASWGLIQFIQFLEGRVALSPHVTNLVALALALLLPGVALLAWSQGRPGPDQLGRVSRVGLPLNLVVAAAVLFVVFHDKELGAVTTNISVTDEQGQVQRRQVPRAAFRKQLLIYDLAAPADTAQTWLGRGLGTLVALDLTQDPFLTVRRPEHVMGSLIASDFKAGEDVPAPVMRRIARDRHFPYYVTGRVAAAAGGVRVTTELQESETGRMVASHDITASDLFAACDQISAQLKRDLEIPENQLASREDLPVAEITTTNRDALRAFIEGSYAAIYENDWEASVAKLQRAVVLDPTFALAQYSLSGALSVTGHGDKATAAADAAMAHLYRLPERSQFQIKSLYYLNFKQDPDRTLAVVDMWTQLYPQDTDAWRQKAMFQRVRDDRAGAIASYEKALAIDPQLHDLLLTIGDLYQDTGDYARAESSYQKYCDRFPTNTKAWTALATLYETAGNLDKARSTDEHILILDPVDTKAQLALARLAMRRGDFARSREIFEEFLAHHDKDIDLMRAHDGLRNLCSAEGRLQNAIANLEAWHVAASHLYNPIELTMRYVMHLDLYTEAGRPEDAIRIVNELRGSVTPPIDKLVDYGQLEAQVALGNLDGARAIIDGIETTVEALDLEVWRPHIDRGRALVADAEGDLADAVACRRRVAGRITDNLQVLLELATALRKAGQPDEALAVLDHLTRLAPALPPMHLEYGRILAARGDAEPAREHLQKALAAWQQADDGFAPRAEARQLLASLGTGS